MDVVPRRGDGGEKKDDTRSSPRPIIFADLFAAAKGDTLPWQPWREGVEICRVYECPGGPSAAFLRYAAGARLGRHDHPGYEHIFVLSGSQTDDNGVHLPGALLVHPPGTSHAVTTGPGCVVLAYWEKPVAFRPEVLD